MARRRRWLLGALGIAAALLLLAAGSAYAPVAVRSVDAFRVQTVRVEGVRFLDPYAVIRAAGIGPASSVFDDADAWRYGILTLPLVEAVDVRRRPPSSLVITVREVEPLALVAWPELRPVDASGRALEIDAAGAWLDLPILTGATTRGGRVVEDGLAALETLAALRSDAPELADRISQLELVPDGVRVLFRDDPAEALLPVLPEPVQLKQLRIAFADLNARDELSRVGRIDLRFRDQVVVSFLSSRE